MDCIGERILNAFCGAVAVYDEECKTFCFQYCPEKVVQLLGYDMPYFDLHFSNDIVNIGLHFFLKNVRPYAASCSEA